MKAGDALHGDVDAVMPPAGLGAVAAPDAGGVVDDGEAAAVVFADDEGDGVGGAGALAALAAAADAGVGVDAGAAHLDGFDGARGAAVGAEGAGAVLLPDDAVLLAEIDEPDLGLLFVGEAQRHEGAGGADLRAAVAVRRAEAGAVVEVGLHEPPPPEGCVGGAQHAARAGGDAEPAAGADIEEAVEISGPGRQGARADVAAGLSRAAGGGGASGRGDDRRSETRQAEAQKGAAAHVRPAGGTRRAGSSALRMRGGTVRSRARRASVSELFGGLGSRGARQPRSGGSSRGRSVRSGGGRSSSSRGRGGGAGGGGLRGAAGERGGLASGGVEGVVSAQFESLVLAGLDAVVASDAARCVNAQGAQINGVRLAGALAAGAEAAARLIDAWHEGSAAGDEAEQGADGADAVAVEAPPQQGEAERDQHADDDHRQQPRGIAQPVGGDRAPAEGLAESLRCRLHDGRHEASGDGVRIQPGQQQGAAEEDRAEADQPRQQADEAVVARVAGGGSLGVAGTRQPVDGILHHAQRAEPGAVDAAEEQGEQQQEAQRQPRPDAPADHGAEGGDELQVQGPLQPRADRRRADEAGDEGQKDHSRHQAAQPREGEESVHAVMYRNVESLIKSTGCAGDFTAERSPDSGAGATPTASRYAVASYRHRSTPCRKVGHLAHAGARPRPAFAAQGCSAQRSSGDQ